MVSLKVVTNTRTASLRCRHVRFLIRGKRGSVAHTSGEERSRQTAPCQGRGTLPPRHTPPLHQSFTSFLSPEETNHKKTATLAHVPGFSLQYALASYDPLQNYINMHKSLKRKKQSPHVSGETRGWRGHAN